MLALVFIGCGGKRPPHVGETAKLIDAAKEDGCAAGSASASDALSGAQFSCTKPLGECGCRAVVSVHSPDGSPDADIVQLVVANCRHEIAAPAASELMTALFANAFRDEIDRPLHEHRSSDHSDVDAPSTAMSVSHHYVDSSNPDRDVAIDWFQDAFSDGAHPATPQRTETIKIVVSAPRAPGDHEMTWSTSPTITNAPACASHPPIDAEMASIPAGPPISVVLRCPPTTGEGTVPAFEIDRHLVSCDDYERCVDAHACPDEPNHCRAADTAVVTHTAAAGYCKWRHARLPTLQEWQRAVRGDATNVYPTGAAWDSATGCRVQTWKGSVPGGRPRCENTSAAGVKYYVLDPNENEWIGDDDCASPKDPAHREPLGMMLFTERLDRALPSSPAVDHGEFRCARAPQAK